MDQTKEEASQQPSVVAENDVEEVKCETKQTSSNKDSQPNESIAGTNDEETKQSEEKTKETKNDTKSEPDTTDNDKKTDSDSDSESEEDREKEIEDRKKARQENEQYKQKMRKILVILIGIEVIICSMLASTPSGVIIEDTTNYIKSRVYNFRNDTMDVVMVSLLRFICLYGFIYVSLKWGDVKNYDENQEKHTIFNTKASHYKLVTKIRGIFAYITLILWDRIIVLNRYTSVNNDGINSLCFKQNEIEGNDMITDKKKKMKRIFDLQEFFSKYDGMNAREVADLWKSVLWMLLFFVLTIFQTYVGIKISFFQNNNNYYFYIILFVLVIILTHIQTYITKKFIDSCCEPENCYFDVRIHPHPLFKIKNKGKMWTYCQLCHEKPDNKTKKGKFIFKCSKCSRWRSNVCVKCWDKKKKEFRKKKKDSEEEKDKDVTFKEYFVTLFWYHMPYIHLLLVGVIAMGITAVINVFVPRQHGQLLDKIIGSDFDGFYYAIKMQIFLKVFDSIIQNISSISMSQVSKQIQCDLQKRIFSNIMSQDMTFFDEFTYSQISNRLNWGLREMLAPFQSSIRMILSSTVSVFGSLYMCAIISWRLTFLGLSTLGPMSYLMSLMYKSNNERWYIQHEIQSEMHMISSHAINKIKVVKAFVKEHELVKHYNTLRQESHDVDNKNKLFQSINQIINGWFGLGTKILLTWMAGIIILTNSDTDINSNSYNTNLTVGLFVTFQTYWYRLYSTLQGMEKTFSSYDQAFFMAKKIFRTLAKKASIEHSIVDKIKNKKVQNLKNEINGNIQFKNVEFFYESAPKKLVLKKLNFEIEKGKTTALVGRSGGGKSTIMHLILRFYDPTKGIITINNIDLKQYNPYALRRQIALVSQDTELFHKSMEYNIGYGGNKEINNEYESMYNLEQVEYASKLANAHKFISEMDEKYDTKMGSRANRCSGGQKQRISIARMLMSKPKIMLLDEATSSLDAESEALVQAAMERECEQSNCTLVIVAHRLSTVVNADKICVVDEGQVVESGTHEELLEMKGIYASLVERQINLRSKMKEKLDKIKNGENNDEKEDEKDDDDFDNIDKLIDQIKAEKEEKVKKEKENEKEDKIDDKIDDKIENKLKTVIEEQPVEENVEIKT